MCRGPKTHTKNAKRLGSRVRKAQKLNPSKQIYGCKTTGSQPNEHDICVYCTYTHICIYICMLMCTYRYVYMYMYIYKRTRSQTHSLSLSLPVSLSLSPSCNSTPFVENRQKGALYEVVLLSSFGVTCCQAASPWRRRELRPNTTARTRSATPHLPLVRRPLHYNSKSQETLKRSVAVYVYISQIHVTNK